jgi:hypothetical protein
MSNELIENMTAAGNFSCLVNMTSSLNVSSLLAALANLSSAPIPSSAAIQNATTNQSLIDDISTLMQSTTSKENAGQKSILDLMMIGLGARDNSTTMNTSTTIATTTVTVTNEISPIETLQNSLNSKIINAINNTSNVLLLTSATTAAAFSPYLYPMASRNATEVHSDSSNHHFRFTYHSYQ